MDNREPSRLTYAFLESAFDSGELVVRESGVGAPEGPIRHAIDPVGRRILMIPITDSEFDQFLDDRAGTSVGLRRERYAENNKAEPFLVFRCESAFLRDTFAAFVDDVLDEFAAKPARTDPAPMTARSILDKWRRLFATRGAGLLSDQAVIGLAAELRVILGLVAEIGPVALESWTGPTGADHDVVLPELAIEIKSTQRKTGLELEINGLGQLAVPSDRELYLAASRVAFSPTGEVSVPTLVDEALKRGVDRELLAEKLEAVGYHHARAEDYEKRRLDFIEDRFFHVTDAFPRIDSTVIGRVSQSDRIRDVSYLLDLTAHETVPGALAVESIEAFFKETL